MRILHIVHQYLPEKVGGTELYTRTLAQQQVEQGHAVAIFTPASDAPAAYPAIEAGVQVYRVMVGQRSPTAVFRNTFHQPQLNAALTAVIAQFAPDIVHIQHLMGLPFSLVAQLRAANIPYLITLHDYWHVCANAQLLTNYSDTICAGPTYFNCARCALARAGHGNALPLVPPLAPLFAVRNGRLRQILQNANAIITPTAFTRDIHVQQGVAADNIHVVPHGIELPPTESAIPSGGDGLRVGYVGGISQQKGVHVLIAAVNQHPQIKLTIIGDLYAFPDYVNELRGMAGGNVTFAGRIPHAELWQMLADFDLIVVPTLWYETASLIVQEAFAAGVPVVASRIGVFPERVADGVDGLLFPAGNADALADLLRHLHDNPQELTRLRAGIQPVFTIDEHIAKIDALYRSIL